MEHYRAVIKVTFVGAGSVEFTRNVATDLCSYPEFRGRLHLALYDISAERLAHAERLVRRISAQTGAGRHGDRDARTGARRWPAPHYVINEVQVGGYDGHPGRLRHPGPVRGAPDDRRHPRHRRDLPRPADHPGGARRWPGTCTRCARTPTCSATATRWPCCPGRSTRAPAFGRVYGLCHSVRDTQAFLTELVGADPDRVRFLTAGFNHQAFVLRFEQDGESLYPRLAEVIEASPELQRRVRVEIYRRFGYFPTESSEHSAEYVPWFMRHDDQIERFRIFVGDYLERSEENLRELESLAAAAGGGRAARPDAGARAGVAVHPLAGDRHRARAAREHPQRRADLQPARRVLRRGALPGRRGRRPSRCRSARCRRSSPR